MRRAAAVGFAAAFASCVQVGASDGGEDAGYPVVDCAARAQSSDAGNIAPCFPWMVNLELDEDAPEQQVALIGLTAGSPDEDLEQRVAVTATVAGEPVIGPVTVEGDGGIRVLRFAPRPDAVGTAQVVVSAVDDGTPPATYSQRFNVSLAPVNDPPRAAPVPHQIVRAGNSISFRITGLGPGGGPDEAAQPVSASIVTDRPDLFTSITITQPENGTAVVTAGTLATVEGTAQVTVTLDDEQEHNRYGTVVFPLSATRDPPIVSAVRVEGSPVAGCATVTYTVAQAEGLPVAVYPEVDIGQGYLPAVTSGGADLKNVSAPQSGATHSFVWRSTANAPLPVSNAKLRVTAARGQAYGRPVEIAVPSIANDVTFSPRASYPGGPGTQHAQLADVNGDGRLDAITADAYGNGISVLAGQDGGTFGAPVRFASVAQLCGGLSPKVYSVDLADLNKDGRLDAILVLQNCNQVSVLRGQPGGTFGTPVLVPVGNNPLYGAVGDFDKDGFPDYAVANFDTIAKEVSVLLNDRAGGFRPQVRYPVGSEPTRIRAADVDGDKALDLVTADLGDSISVLYGKGDGTFAPRVALDAGVVAPRNLAVADFNGDGRADMATCSPGATAEQWKVAFVMSSGPRSWGPASFGDAGSHPRATEALDVNADGQPDVVVGNFASHDLSVYMNLGGGRFAPPFRLAAGSAPQGVTGGDVDGDGKLDLVSANADSQDLSVLLNTSRVCGP